MSGLEPMAVVAVVELGWKLLKTVLDDAEQAEANRTALLELAKTAEDQIGPLLSVIEQRVKIEKDEMYIKDAVDRLRECLVHISDLVKRWSSARSRYRKFMDYLYGENKKICAEIIGVEQSMNKQVIRVQLTLSTKQCESQEKLIHGQGQILMGQDVIMHRLNEISSTIGSGQSVAEYGWTMTLNDVTYDRGPVGEPGDILGSGSFAKVFKAKWKLCRDVAIKAAHNPQKLHKDDELRIRFKREVNVLFQLSHKNVVTFFGAIADTQGGPCYWIVTECLELKLGDFLRQPEAPDQDTKIRIISGIASGLSYLHSRSIVHRDIKSENVMLDDYGEVKIIDFGFSKIKDMHDVASGQASTGGAGTLIWMSPEKRENKPSYASSDVYSFGLVMANVLLLQAPNELKPNPVTCLIKSAKSNTDHLYQTICYLAVKCINEDPHARPSALKIISTIRDEQQFDGGLIGSGSRMPAMAEGDESVEAVVGSTGRAASEFNRRLSAQAVGSSSEMNSQGYPVRPDQEDCAYYKRHGQCSYGARCKFNHPDLADPPQPRPERTLALPRKDCRNWLKGFCSYGQKCTFNHDPQKQGIETRPVGTASGKVEHGTYAKTFSPSSLTVKEIKKLLDDAGVDYSNCSEKPELEQLWAAVPQIELCSDLPDTSANSQYANMYSPSILTVKEIKQQLDYSGVDYSDCSEKPELEKRLAQLQANPGMGSARSAPAGATEAGSESGCVRGAGGAGEKKNEDKKNSFFRNLPKLLCHRDINGIVQGMSAEKRLMRRHVQERACEYLLKLSPRIETDEWHLIQRANGQNFNELMEIYKAFEEHGVISAIIQAMSNHMDSVPIAKYVGTLLGDLARNQQCQYEITRSDGIEYMVRAMINHPENPEIQEQGCRVLQNVSALAPYNQDVRRRVTQSRNVDTVIQALEKHQSHRKVQENGRAALKNMRFSLS